LYGITFKGLSSICSTSTLFHYYSIQETPFLNFALFCFLCGTDWTKIELLTSLFNPSTYAPHTHINTSPGKAVLIFVLHLLIKQAEVQEKFANRRGGYAGQGIILKVLSSSPGAQNYL